MPTQTPEKPLSPFEQWMVKSNLDHLEEYGGLEVTVARLRQNGYPRIAAAVEQAAKGEKHG